MVRAVYTVQGALTSSQADGLVGLNDLQLMQTGSGTYLFASARGGGYLTGFDVDNAPGHAIEAGHWHIPPGYLQLESTELVAYDSASGPQLFLAGLAGNGLRGLRLDGDGQGPLIGNQVSVSAPDFSLSLITEMALFGTSSQGIAALRGGGVVSVSFEAGNTLTFDQVNEGPGLQSAFASDVITTTHDGQSYAFVSYGYADSVAMYRQNQNGSLAYIDSLNAERGLWVDQPGALSVTTAADGGLYVVLAASGSDSLSVLSVSGTGMQVVDHQLDTRDTRFDGASHVTSVTIDGQSYVLAAGADSGLSLFVMLPGGRLQHVETFEATPAAPLNGITALEAMAVPGGLRVWASTEAAPYLSEITISLLNLGDAVVAGTNGGELDGSAGSDVLMGGAGADKIFAGAGDDIIIDGAGEDTLVGGSGADTFIFSRDGARDIVIDFDHRHDLIDLSGFGTLDGLGDLTLQVRSWGVRLSFGDEELEIRYASDAPLEPADFGIDNLILGGRVEIDLSLYPEPGSGDPDPPPPEEEEEVGSGPARAQLAGEAPSFAARGATPSFSLDQSAATTFGTAAPNTLLTYGASDYVFGLQGADTISTGDGNDSVSGGGGNDLIDSGNGADLVLGDNGFDTIFAGDGHDTIAGGSGADSIRGGAGNDLLLGGVGYDQLHGEGGNDSIWGGATADRIYGGDGDDFISAGTNFGITVDGIWGQAGDDTIYGDGGYDYLDGGDGRDVLDGGDQADNLYGRGGADLLLGGQGLDRLFGGSGDDQLYGGDGPDGHFGEGGEDTMWGGTGNDRFFGGRGRDIIDGGPGSDTIYGGADFDTVIGGEGDDQLFGNFNADTFVFANFHGHDRIADFDANNTLERIDLSAMTLFTEFATVASLATQDGADVLITTGQSSSIRLTGVSLSDLDASDFIF